MSESTARPWRTGSLESYNAYTGEREMFIYRLPPDDPEETAHNRICVRGSGKMDCVADAEFIVTAVNNHDALTAQVSELRAVLKYAISLNEHDHIYGDHCGDLGCWVGDARAALAKGGE